MTANDISIGNDVTMRSSAQAVLGRIDQYELLKELGGGGFGTVYLARDTVSGVEVAVKGLPPLVRNNKEELENIRANFALVSRLHHPNIAAALVLHPVLSVSYGDKVVSENLRVFEGDTLMVMEYAPGVTLSQWRKQFPDGKVPIEQAIAIARQIASALDYAHEQKIIHRDVKPSNVMIETRADGSLVARVLDFGLAAEIRSSMGRISQEIHDTSGTRPYMAPEQWLGGRQGPATDQYSLAVLFYELITGEVPFASVFETGDPVVMMNVVGREKPTIPNDFTRGVQKVLLRAFAKTPEKRFASCSAFVRDIEKTDGPFGEKRSFDLARFLALFAVSLAVALFLMWNRFSPGQNVRDPNDMDAPPQTENVETNAPLAAPDAMANAVAPVNQEPSSRVITTNITGDAAVAVTDGSPQVVPPPGTARPLMVFESSANVVFTITNDVKMVFVPLWNGTNGPYIGTTEVTRGQWLALVGTDPSRNQASLQHPVECVSQSMCRKYCEALTRRFSDSGWRFRLMRSDEWRELCSGGGGGSDAYHWGNDVWDAEGNDMANFQIDASSPLGTTKPVGSYSANLRGIFDLHGNVAEWTEDAKICGGAYLNAADDCTVMSAVRIPEQTNSAYPHVGFRLVAER